MICWLGYDSTASSSVTYDRTRGIITITIGNTDSTFGRWPSTALSNLATLAHPDEPKLAPLAERRADAIAGVAPLLSEHGRQPVANAPATPVRHARLRGRAPANTGVQFRARRA